METEILNTLTGIFRHVLKREDIELKEETTAHDVEGWDSLTNMLLINEIEKTYHIRFTFRNIAKMKNVGDLCQKIEEKK